MEHNGSVIDIVNDVTIIKCNNCHFKHLQPIPTAQELIKFYTKKYYSEHKKDYISQDNTDIEYLKIAFSDRIKRFKQFSKEKKMLDIGCGSGMFMEYASKKGYYCTGIEPSKMASRIALNNKLNVLNYDMDYFFNNNSELYDIIHLKNVLEHVLNPVEIIQNCHRVLNQNGIIYIEVPNDYNLFQRLGVKLFNNPKSWLAVPDHINYFNFSTLKSLLTNNGFKIVKRDTTFPIYFLSLIGLNFIKYKQKGKKAHKIRMNFDLFLQSNKLASIRRMIYQILSHLNLGRTIIYYARKQEYK